MLTLYNKTVTEISFQTLQKIIHLVDFDLCLCGGWAVYFTVNDTFKRQKNREYIGSQDIDIGFSLPPMMAKTELEATALFQMLKILERNGYEPARFGYKKEFPLEPSDTINDEAKETIFTLYVDILVNSYPPSYQDIHPQCFFEVPLLETIYTNEHCQIRIPELSPNVFIPTCEMLCAMKILSLPSRGDHHKRVKDLCDVYSLIWFTDTSPESIRTELSELMEPVAFERLNKIVTRKLMRECEYYLGEPEGSVPTVIHQLL